MAHLIARDAHEIDRPSLATSYMLERIIDIGGNAQAAGKIISRPKRHESEGRATAGRGHSIYHLVQCSVATRGDDQFRARFGGFARCAFGVSWLAADFQPFRFQRRELFANGVHFSDGAGDRIQDHASAHARHSAAADAEATLVLRLPSRRWNG